MLTDQHAHSIKSMMTCYRIQHGIKINNDGLVSVGGIKTKTAQHGATGAGPPLRAGAWAGLPLEAGAWAGLPLEARA